MRLVAALLGLALATGLQAQIAFVPGHYYSTTNSSANSSPTITEWDQNRVQVGSLTLPAAASFQINGLVFGQDGLLYAVSAYDFSTWRVIALNSSGTIVASYPLPFSVFGNISYGKIDVGNGYIYMAGGALVRIRIGDPASATIIYTGNQIFDVKILPSGNVLVAEAYVVNEINPAGVIVRHFPSNTFMADIRGIAYHASTDKLFITHLGYTDFYFRVMRFNYTSGALETSVTYVYADDLFLDEQGNLLVGSRTLPPVLLTRGLATVGTLGVNPQLFVTQCPSPPVLEKMGFDADGFHLQWFDSTARRWQVEFCDDLAAGAWQPFASLSAPDANGELPFVDATTPLPPKRFYRLMPPSAPAARPPLRVAR